MNLLIKSTLLCLIALFISACSSNGPTTITITPLGDQMKYEVTSFEVDAGSEVRLVMKNTAKMDAMKHNVVILNDASKINEVGLAALSAPDYLPDHPAIIVATPMAGPGETTEATFTAPTKPGTYKYICTFPGHYSMMQGDMIVK